MDLYLSEDGQSGIAVKPNGDIVSVFAGDNAPRGSGYTLMLLAIQNGGRQLDCFDTHLPDYYSLIGFKPVAKMKWNDEYIPEGWNKENFKDYNNGEPDVVFMVYDPNTKKDNEIPYITDYDDGDKIQQKYFAKNKVDSLIDAKKKELKEEDVNRDEDGKFAKKNSSSNKSKDNDKIKDKIKDLDTNALKDFGLNQRQIIKLTTKLEDLGIIEYNEDNDTYKIKSSITEGIENNEIKEILGDKFDIIKNSFNSDNNDNEDDIDNEKPKVNKTVEDCINSVSKHLQTTATKLYQPHNKQKSLILKDNIDYNKNEVMENLNKYIDNDKVKELSELEDTLMSFTSDPNTRHSSYWNEAKDDIRELIEKSPTLKSAPYRVEIVIEGRNNFEIGKEVNFDIRSFTDFENSLENAKKINKEMERLAKKLKEEDEVEEIVIYKIEDEDVNGLDISNLSVYPNQNECLIDGTFIISNVEENKEFGHKVITLKKPKK